MKLGIREKLIKESNKNKVVGVSIAALAALGGTFLLKNKLNKIKKLNEIENSIFITGRVREFGTLYLNGEKQDFSDLSKNPDGIITYDDGPIEIRDSEKGDSKITWIEINDEGKKLLICNKNIIKEIPWSELDSQNLTYGKVIKLGGKKYILRLLTGEVNASGQDFSEWDKYILNISGIEGLPRSTDEDKNDKISEEGAEREKGESNLLWNWCKCCSFTQNEYGKNDKFCIIRGLYSTTYNNYCDKDVAYETVGYRPVLELIE